MNGELYINGRLIDINESLPFPFTYNISDIKDLSTRKGNKSKTITLPGTLNNCALMASVYLTSSREKIITATQSEFLDFDPTIKSRCQYYSNGLLVFEGIAQLLECKSNNGTWSFEISMVSNQIDYIALMKKIKINELDFSEYDHECNDANVTETWSGNNQINGVTETIQDGGGEWLGIGYYYGLIDYGYTRATAETFKIDQIPLQVFVYEILQKLFLAVGLTWESSFFETQIFKKLLLAFPGGTLPEITAGQATNSSVTADENNNAGGFIMNQSVTSSTAQDGFGFPKQIFTNPTTIVDLVDVTILTDPSGQTVTTLPFKFKALTTGLFNIEYLGDHIVDITKTPGGSSYVQYNYKTFLIVKKNNVVISENQIYQNQGSVITTINSTNSFNYFSTINLLVNDELTFEIKSTLNLYDFTFSNSVINTIQFTANSTGVALNINKQIQQLTAGDTVRINQLLPDMTGDLFFKGLITMFNLYLRPKNTDPTIIEIEPLNDFYKDTNAALDWSYLVDRSKEIKVKPTVNIAAQNYNFGFETEDDYYNKKYLTEYGEQYGSFLFNSQNQYATSNTDLKVPFSQKPLALIPTTGLIMPRAFDVNFDESANGQIVPKKGKPFIVQLGKIRDISPKKFILLDGANVPTTYSEYPYVGHLDDIDNPTFDLNFGVPDVVFYTALLYTNNNLYSYHETFIKEIVSRYGKLVNLSVMLNSSIINQLDFKDLILIDGVIYRLQSIKDFDPGKQQSTEIELIRILEGNSAFAFYRITEDDIIRETETYNNKRIIQ